jgi:hypothetical protein
VLRNGAGNSCSVVHGDLVRDMTVSLAAVQCGAVERLTAAAYDLACKAAYDLACKTCGETNVARGLGAWQESAACAVAYGTGCVVSRTWHMVWVAVCVAGCCGVAVMQDGC